ncbi:uncharacterized protein L201_004668 [Kwoniella dendrophila CBS 6074]|uniref:Uncharacterized protein n=1 Tax=Kwoniella dendrophila CBS 6074 TaxID=1295534 RepID=A0AAX4JZ13_9TREE
MEEATRSRAHFTSHSNSDSIPNSPTESTASSSSSSQNDRKATLSPYNNDTHGSPSASLMSRTAETLDGLSKQLGHLKDESENLDNEIMLCCCGNTISTGNLCKSLREREKLEDKLKLSGEIGNALLQRYEALERKYQSSVDKYEKQLEAKRNALVESVRKVNNLEKANTQHLQKYAEISKKNEALEKRYTQAMHTQTLTQQSLTHVRAELTTLRTTSQRQKVALASGLNVEERLSEVEKRYEDAKDLAEIETKKSRDEFRKRKRAEARIEELEAQVKSASKEVEEIKEGRAKDAQDLLANAKERLSVLHSELSETFRTESPSDMPEYQKTLEDLVATNTLLKHDVAELTHSLSESRDESRSLKEEVEELRAAIGTVGRMSPFGRLPTHLAKELGSGHSNHSRTESSPILSLGQLQTQGLGQGHGDRGSWQRMSVASSSRTGGMSAWEHHRKMSMAHSFTSNSSSTADGALMSPGLGMGPIGEFGGILTNEDGSRLPALSPPPVTGRESPKFRTSPNGGIGYVLNGVPKSKPGHVVRPSLARSFSTNTDRRSRRSYASQGVGPIAEWSAGEEVSGITEEPLSPGTDYFRAAEANRKRRSLMLARRSTMSPNDFAEYSPNASTTLNEDSIARDCPSPMSDSALTGNSPKRAKRKTLMLLTRSQGVQTDPIEIRSSTDFENNEMNEESLSGKGLISTSTGTSPIPPVEDHSETSSIQDNRAGILLVVVEHMSRILARLRDADVPTLNKRLKKHNLPGDVAHLSQTTMRALQQEVADLRNQFRGVHNLGGIDRKDFNLLLRLFKDVFTDLVDLQAIVNDVTINPSLGKKLQKAAFREEEDEVSRQAKQASGLGWIAAPITKFFVTPAENPENDGILNNGAPTRKGLERGKLQPTLPVKSAPKQQATASATTTHVSVEFGGTGIVRRASPAMTSNNTTSAGRENVIDDLPSSPIPNAGANDGHDRTISPSNANNNLTGAAGAENSLLPPTLRTVRRSKSKANRNELLGIFAGAQKPSSSNAGSSGTGGDSWAALGHGTPPAGGRTLRSVSSQNFAGNNNDRTIKAKSSHERKRISAIVDAIIDPSTMTKNEDDISDIISGSYEPQPPLLERQLRPRGLSDSSIRSTFVSQSINPVLDNDLSNTITRTRVCPYSNTTTAGGGGVLQSLSKRWYDFRGSSNNEVSPINPDGGSSNVHSESQIHTIPINSAGNIESRSPSKPIPSRSISSSIRSDSISTTHSTRSSTTKLVSPTNTNTNNSSTQNGLFGLIASSLVGNENIDHVADQEDDELVGASLRQSGLRGVSGKSWR